MNRVKAEENSVSTNFTTVPPVTLSATSSSPLPSTNFYQRGTNRMTPLYHPYLNPGQNYMYGASSVQVAQTSQPPPPSPTQWQYQKQHPPPSTTPLQISQHTPPLRNGQPLVFDPSQPPPSFASQEYRPRGPVVMPKNNRIQFSPTPTINPLMLNHPIRARGRGRGRFRGRGAVVCSFERGGILRNSIGNIMNPLSVKSPQLLFNMNTQQQILPNCQMTELDSTDENETLINKKNKRKPMSTRYTRAKEWDHDLAVRALDLENEFNRLQHTPMLILKFPDPDINKYIVKQYSEFIDSVHFQQPPTARYCFVQLKDNADIEKVRKDLSEIPFGTGKLSAERKHTNLDDGRIITPDEIDPYTLYVGNLPTQVSVKIVKEHFPGATRIDIGYAQRMKYTRYAFVRYNTADEAMRAYKSTFNTSIGNRSIIVRFRRSKGNIGLPGESKIPNPKKTAPTATVTTTTLSEIITTLPKNFPTNDVFPEFLPPNSMFDTATTLSDILSKESKNDDQILSPESSTGMSTIPDDMSETSSTVDKYPLDKIKTETDNSLYPDVQNGNGEFPVNTILGTRIKDEPFDDDELLAQAECYEDEDDMDDEDYDEPEEEDDYDDPAAGNPSLTLIKLTAEENHEPPQTLEEFRNSELARKEIKPDLMTLLQFPDDKDDDSNNTATTKIPDPFAKKIEKENLSFSNNIHYNDDLDDLFSSMNPEPETDDYGY